MSGKKSVSIEDSAKEPKKDPASGTLQNVCTTFKYSYSCVLLIFSIAIVMAMIYQQDTKLSQVNSALAFVLIWVFVIWLSMVEGGQAALVGLGPVCPDLYRTTHPITFKCMALANKGNNLDRFLIGRQFLVVLIVFIINLCGAPVGDVTVFGMPPFFQEVFVHSSLALILMTAMAAQLHPQVNATRSMLDFTNNNFMLITLSVSLGLEACGAMHTVYLLQKIFSKLSGTQLESFEAPRTITQSILFWGRVVFSVALLGFSFAVTLTALFKKKTNMWEGVPAGVSVVIFFLLMIVLGILEGTQIAVFSVSRLPVEEQAKHPAPVRKTLELLFRNEGRNIPRFMIGRQIIVTVLVFVIARITTVNVDIEAGEEPLFGSSNAAQQFYNTGLLGTIIVTILGSILWRLIGSSFPVLFLSNPLVYLFIQMSLCLEGSGICSGAWVLAAIHKWIAGFQLDEKYVGKPEDRAAQAKPDSTLSLTTFHEPANQVGSKRFLHEEELAKVSTPFPNDCEAPQYDDSPTPVHSDDSPSQVHTDADDNSNDEQRRENVLPEDLYLPQTRE